MYLILTNKVCLKLNCVQTQLIRQESLGTHQRNFYSKCNKSLHEAAFLKKYSTSPWVSPNNLWFCLYLIHIKVLFDSFFISRNIWKYNLMHLTHNNTFTVHYIKDFTSILAVQYCHNSQLVCSSLTLTSMQWRCYLMAHCW